MSSYAEQEQDAREYAELQRQFQQEREEQKPNPLVQLIITVEDHEQADEMCALLDEADQTGCFYSGASFNVERREIRTSPHLDTIRPTFGDPSDPLI